MNENIPAEIAQILKLERELAQAQEQGEPAALLTALEEARVDAAERLGWTYQEVKNFVAKCRDPLPKRQNVVRVIVSGATGSGKTTICRILAKALQEAGIMNLLDDDSLGVCRDQPLEKCVEGLKKMDTMVQISTHQTPRVPTK